MISVQTQQILVPKQVYIGDRAEIRCSFNIDSQVLKLSTEKGTTKLSLDNFCDSLDFTQYEIKEVQLVPSGVNYYNLVVSFVPWRTGNIQLPDYKLTEKDSANEEFIIHFEPVSIVSLTEKDSITVLKDITPPLLLPGTIYKIYGGLIALLIFLIVAIRLIVKHKAVALFIKNRMLIRKYNKNKKQTIKQLNKLCDSEGTEAINDHDVAEQIQKLMRNYLEVRFEYPFTKTVTSEMSAAFEKATCGLLSEEKRNACDEIISVFVRTDFIRYSSDGKFLDEERKKIVQKLMNDIEIIESADLKSEEEENA